MNQHCLSPLFSPHSVAVIGASSRMESVGGVTFRNVLQGGYQGNQFALVIADEWHHKGIGHRLMDSLMEVARSKGLNA